MFNSNYYQTQYVMKHKLVNSANWKLLVTQYRRNRASELTVLNIAGWI